MRFVIVTGMSGAGKSTTLKMLEDMGYFCVDNLPVPLLPKLTELLFQPGGEIAKAALGLDIRSGQRLGELESILQKMDREKMKYEVCSWMRQTPHSSKDTRRQEEPILLPAEAGWKAE